MAKILEEWEYELDLNPTKYRLKKILKDKINYPHDYQKGTYSHIYDVNHLFSHAQEVCCYSTLIEGFQNSGKDKPHYQILSKDYLVGEHV